MGRYNLKSLENMMVRRRCWKAYIPYVRPDIPLWHIFWGHVSFQQHRCLLNQRVNGFYNHMLSCKDTMEEQIRRAEDAAGSLKDAFDFRPQTWILPKHKSEMEKYLKSTEKEDTEAKGEREIFIAKPSGLNRGDGIFLFHSLSQYETEAKKRPDILEEYVVQRYVQKPLLIHGYKFDLRLYVLVSSFWPLRLHLYRNGLVRFCSEPYSTLSDEELHNPFRQLTNYSVNKKNTLTNYSANKKNTPTKPSPSTVTINDTPNPSLAATPTQAFPSSGIPREPPGDVRISQESPEIPRGSCGGRSPGRDVEDGKTRDSPGIPNGNRPPEIGGDSRSPGESEEDFFVRVIGKGAKWTLSRLQGYVEARPDQFPEGWERIWRGIIDVIILTFLSGSQTVRTEISTFGVFGVDIMLDHNQKAILMETNSFPSLHTSTPLDRQVKLPLLNDVFNLLRLDELCDMPPCHRVALPEYLFGSVGVGGGIDAAIEVTGAGSWLPNGEYLPAGRCDGVAMFQRIEREYIVTISRAKSESSGHVKWWISRVDCYTGTGKEIHYYTAKSSSSAFLPPETGWVTCSGINPPPTLKVKWYKEYGMVSGSQKQKIREVVQECTRLDDSKKGGFVRIFPFNKPTKDVARLQNKYTHVHSRNTKFPEIVQTVINEIRKRRMRFEQQKQP